MVEIDKHFFQCIFRKIFMLGLILVAYCKLEAIPIGSGHSDYLQFEHITSIEGLSNNTVYDITQDDEGFIWIATQEGLNKYDSRRITSYYLDTTANNNLGNVIRQVTAIFGGEIVIGTEKGATIYNQKNNSYSTLLYKNKPLGRIYSTLKLSTGEVLIAAHSALFYLNKNLEIKKLNDISFRFLCEYKKGIIWAASGYGIHLINADGELIKSYTNQSLGKRYHFDFSSENIQCIFKDSRDIIWLGTMRNGLGYYQPETDEFISLSLDKGVNPIEDNFVRAINEDNQGKLWIGTESGLYIYDVEEQAFQFYGQSFNPNEKGLTDKAIYSIYCSVGNVMWVGTYFGGVNYTTPYQKGFSNIYADGGVKSLSGSALSEMIETHDGKIWIGTEDGGISIFDRQTGKFEYIKHSLDDPHSLSSNNVHALEEDSLGNIWIGTFIGGLNKYHIKTGKIENINLIHPDTNFIKSVFSVFIDSKQRIWVGAIAGLYMNKDNSREFEIFKPEIFQSNFIYQVGEDHEGNIWACSYLSGIYKIDSELQVTNYQRSNTPSLLSDEIVYYYLGSDNIIWFGTREGGLVKYDPETGEFKSYTTQNGLNNNTIYAITEDIPGNIWLSTNKGISTFNPVNEKFRNYTENDGLIGNQYNYKSCLTTSDGIIYFGAVNGLTYFNPVLLSLNYYEPVLHFTDFKLFNKSLEIGEKKILSQLIDYHDEINLKYKYNVFTLEFVGINYNNPRSIQYAYYLEGFENDWNYVGQKNNATYTNLSPGQYEFRLKVANSDGFWSDEIRIVHINIKPPLWLSAWGYSFYALFLLFLFYLYRRYTNMRNKEKLDIQMATLEKQKNEEITQHKLNFFTYISHEFKTPLTIVIATIEEFLQFDDVLPRIKEYGILIKKNALRLLFLINQLMDFRKIETDHASLKFNKIEIISYIRNVFETFYPLFERKAIVGEFTVNIDRYEVYFDSDKLEKIITNLVSNAYNAFESDGRIHIDVKVHERINTSVQKDKYPKHGELIVTITDNGPGIPESKLVHIFEPFSSGPESIDFRSGIGLALVKSLVNFLNGSISIESTVGKGTSITFRIPFVYNPKPELIHDKKDQPEGKMKFLVHNIIFGENDFEQTQLQPSNNGGFKKYDILIVEDNNELASFLVHYFSKVFNTIHAINGKNALEIIGETQPDIIVSDIMMPVINGLELCQIIKESIETCHIPIILLTAKSGIESKLEGLDMGADAYISKPFNLKELDLIIRNILKIRENIKLQFTKHGLVNETISKLGNRDQAFLGNLTEIVHEQIDNPYFNVDAFCKKLLISRTSLHMKIKKLTGMSTTEFINTIRLTKAKEMLRNGDHSVSEVAFMVGYEDPAYFSKSFKKKFNINPSQMIQKEEL